MSTHCIFCGAAKDATLSTEAQVDCCTDCVWKYVGPPAAYCLTARAGAWVMFRREATRHPWWRCSCHAILDGMPFVDAAKYETFKDWATDASGHVAEIEKERF